MSDSPLFSSHFPSIFFDFCSSFTQFRREFSARAAVTGTNTTIPSVEECEAVRSEALSSHQFSFSFPSFGLIFAHKIQALAEGLALIEEEQAKSMHTFNRKRDTC